MTDLGRLINRSLSIGRRTIATRLVLAPMSLLGNLAFRHLLDDMGGCGLMFSEMCSAARIPQENRQTSACFRWRDAEADRLSIQLLGGDPLKMAAAARRVAAEGLFGVDINMGCAVRAVCKHNQGAALLRNHKAAADLVARVRATVDCPVTVKFRTGWSDDPRAPVELARRLADAGADALIFHPRVAPDVRTRPARWDHIARVKAAVSIPVFGNGDVFDPADCLRMFQTTGCDGIALGRIAIARPWVFAHWGGGPSPPPAIYLESALKLLSHLSRYFDPITALRRFERHGAYLAANFAYGNTLHNRIRNAPDLTAVRAELAAFFQDPPRLLSRPNLNLMA